LQAIKEEAQSIGMQGGLAEQSREINATLSANEDRMDRVFNFNLLLYKNNVLPPVLESMEHSLEMSSQGEALRIGGQTYRILQQVRFVATPPTWRDYLWMHYPYPELPNKILLPQTSAEEKVWSAEIYHAWDMGRDQAVEIFKINVNRLSRDFRGMLLYKKMLMKHMVSPVEVEKTELGITGNAGQMVIDDQSWKITSKPALQVHSKFWTPVMRERVNIKPPEGGESHES
jgi:defect-in-organelle-trafficking protein DotC